MAYIRRATVADAIYVAPRLREADKQETWAYLGLDPLNVLPRNVAQDPNTWTMVGNDGSPVGLFGVSAVATLPYFGLVWMCSTDAIHDHKRELIVMAPQWLDKLHALHPLLGNHIDARNTVHVRWLRRMGFSLLRTHQHFGVEGRPFHEFARLKHVQCAPPS